ncbi:MAG: hypothetical protein M1821_005583 [Bathelium mastoideum]|nr:MAG: hypothetical protein M1821_005583 [Bathelium mastoideum]
MAILTDDSKKTLGSQFESLFKNKWNIKPDSPTILSLHRNTAKDSKSFRTISCGNKDAVSGIPNIGEYWADLTVPSGETARDVEAYFLDALDLFTFLGIPTVSIGLRNMIGEFRHELLAKEAFKRVNVQYDQPRHNATAYIKPKIKDSLPQLSSPLWSGDAPDGVKKRDAGNNDDKRRQQAEKPSSFTAFDKIVLEAGLKIASEKHLKWIKSIQSLKEGISANPTRTHTAFQRQATLARGRRSETSSKSLTSCFNHIKITQSVTGLISMAFWVIKMLWNNGNESWWGAWGLPFSS